MSNAQKRCNHKYQNKIIAKIYRMPIASWIILLNDEKYVEYENNAHIDKHTYRHMLAKPSEGWSFEELQNMQ